MALAEQVAADARALPRAFSSKRASARRFEGASKSTSSMLTGPSLCVCNWKRPSSFSEEPSSTASAAASATSAVDGGG